MQASEPLRPVEYGSAAPFETYTSNILAAYAAATPAQRERGRLWYPMAHDFAVMLADGGDVRMIAGAIAGLSAQKSWERNHELARRAAADDISEHTRDTLQKVALIMAGADPAEVLAVVSKTGHFYRCIADPADPDAVVIDRHAHDIAVGVIYGDAERGLGCKGRYAFFALCYREAARRLGLLPQVLQAITWVAHTERKSK